MSAIEKDICDYVRKNGLKCMKEKCLLKKFLNMKHGHIKAVDDAIEKFFS